MQSKVSMVVPCYNKVQYIGEMLDSVVAQRWDNIEVILVNDGSTDGTREVITEYEPKLQTRGYEVFIIDQENRGLPGAVHSGLEYITGEFVCMPDCDDVLHPGYVSTMAEYLDAHPETMWVTCDTDKWPYDSESHPALKKHANINGIIEYPYKLFESILLKRLSRSVCNRLSRASYLAKCNIIDKFVEDPRVNQEPQIILPLILGGAKPVFWSKVLYYYKKREGSIINKTGTDLQKALEYAADTHTLFEKTLRLHGAYNDYSASLLSVFKIYEKYLYLSRFDISEDDYALEFLDAIKRSNLMRKHIDEELALKAGVGVTHRWFSNIVIGYPRKRVNISRKAGAKIVAYAAFGKGARSIQRGLLNSDICPNEFWDIAAKPGDQIDGIPVMRPDFESLTSKDIVLVLIKGAAMAQGVKESLEKTPAIENTWYYYDVLDHLADFYFSERM